MVSGVTEEAVGRPHSSFPCTSNYIERSFVNTCTTKLRDNSDVRKAA